ncbi:hypothetical protein LCG56_27595 (plasmid) [Pseudomonas cannabina pv. alisalensis]|uniref:Uncharacterized protein n=1 Tax=Pseudomonas syringae pv. maculicola str. ES4326 TaxID=629265 RepID=A0A8T8CB57_PSEYM|nr:MULTISPECIES: hypothetical protein [Pseudomonas syringae group]QHF00547.1 hypothetical protein PMA4326_028975 [Pseudomonas syringae pv. maculicola str. ES4326]UBZ00528.1 hypothetical protein LCG56_27595 [Pseudomonas cannabina pv. alisalensis]
MPPKINSEILPEIAEKLGVISDRQLAKLSGLSPYYIKQARLARGIEALSRGYNLPDELLQQLGKVPDTQLTDRYGVPGPVLCRARKERSIPRFRILHKPDSREYVAFSGEAIALLGKIPDVHLAKRFDRSLVEVKQERVLRGLEPCAKGRKLPCELVQQLGLVPDSLLATRYSVAAGTIRRAREARSIPRFRFGESFKANQGSRAPAYRPSARPNESSLEVHPELTVELACEPARTSHNAVWTTHVLTQLGQVKDSEIAKLTGLSVSAVRIKRTSLGIPPATEFVWSADLLSRLGQVKDKEIARLAGISPSAVGLKRKSLGIPPALAGGWTQELLSLLGKVSDKELAEQSCGALSENSVCKARLHRKIPAFVAAKPPSKAEGAKVRRLLGVVNDYEIARRTGVERSDITRLRLKLGIEPAKSGRLPRGKSKRRDTLPAPKPVFGIKSEAKGGDKIWSQEEEALLGTAADSKVAALLKVDFWIVYYRRRAMNIPAFEFAYS